jgi:hypothetical protein
MRHREIREVSSHRSKSLPNVCLQNGQVLAPGNRLKPNARFPPQLRVHMGRNGQRESRPDFLDSKGPVRRI